MITPRQGLLSIMLRRIPSGRKLTSWLFTKRSVFVPEITENKSIH